MTNYTVQPGDTIRLSEERRATTPFDIAEFLHRRSWIQAGDDRWQHQQQQCWGFTWEQAVAYEFYMFASIGGMPR